MAFAHLVVRRTALGDEEVLLAQRNVYLAPRGRYEFAAIAHHATQYILPGGKINVVEQPIAAVVREFYEDTGLAVPMDQVRPLCVVGDRTFFEVMNPQGLELGRVNAALTQGTAKSGKTNNMTWVSIDSAASWMGMKTEYQHLPWVTEQVTRAVQAGFGREHIAPRVGDSHEPFLQALKAFRGIGNTVAINRVDYQPK